MAASGAVMVEDGAEPEITEGAGTIGRELVARGDLFDAVLVPLGNGALLNGVGTWLKAVSPSTRVVGACSEGAPAMEESWRKGGVVAHEGCGRSPMASRCARRSRRRSRT